MGDIWLMLPCSQTSMVYIRSTTITCVWIKDVNVEGKQILSPLNHSLVECNWNVDVDKDEAMVRLYANWW